MCCQPEGTKTISPARWTQGGSIGQTGMGRVHKGQKMAGRMGAEKVTVFNLQVRKRL